jgi:small subunit ribosomal protein S17
MEERNLRRSIQGVVVSNKNDKTIGVLVETHKRHAKYGKRVKYRKKYYAHDEKNEAKVGDVVTIMETRKLSATKRYRLVSIDKTAELSVKEAEAELKEEILSGEVSLENKEEAKVEEKAEVKEEKTAEPEVKEAPKVRKPRATKKPASEKEKVTKAKKDKEGE